MSEIPAVVTNANYDKTLHAELHLNRLRAQKALEEAEQLLKDAETAATSTSTFATYGDPTPPQTVVLGDQAVTITFMHGRGGGWNYTVSEVAS